MEIFNRFENVCFVEALSCMKNIKKTFTQTGFADLIYLLSPVPKERYKEYFESSDRKSTQEAIVL